MPVKVSGRRQGIAWRALVTACFTLVLLSVASVRAQVEPPTPDIELKAHQSDPVLQARASNAVCKDASVAARLEWLEEDVALAHAATDYNNREITKLERERDRLVMSYEHAGSTYEGKGKFQMPYNEAAHQPGESMEVERVKILEGQIDSLMQANSAIEDRRQADLDEIAALNAKPKCVPPPQTPPPPPGGTQPPGNPPALPNPSSGTATPTHRTTSCSHCKKAEKALNDASDKLLADQKVAGVTKAQLDADLADVRAKAVALDNCEKSCHEHSSATHHQHAVTEDNPAYMENYQPPAQLAHGHSTHHEDNGRPPRLPREDRPDGQPEHNPYQGSPDIPVPQPHDVPGSGN